MANVFQQVAVDKGFHLYILPTNKFKTTSFRVVLRRNLRPEEHSLNAVIPFVLRRGTRTRSSAREIARYMEELYGAQFGADIGKIGETQQIELSAAVADEQFLPEQIGLTRTAMSFLAEALMDPVLENGAFRSEYVAQEAEMLRRRIESTINNRPQYAVNRLREEMCRDEPFGLHKYGSLDSLRDVTPSRLFEHYRHVLETSPVDLFVVGPVDVDEITALVKEHFTLPRGDIDETVPAVTHVPDEERTVVEEQPVQQGVLAMGYRTGVRYADDDYPAMLVYNGILGGFPHSKLFINVRERASLAYFASSQLEATKGILIVAAGIAVEKYDQALQIIREQIDAIADGDVSTSELDQTKKGLVNGLLSNLDSPGRLAGGRLVGIVNDRVRTAAELIEDVQAVTVDDVTRVARQVQADTVYFLRSPGAQ